MKLGFDGHIFRWQKNGGISRYFREIINHLDHAWSPVLLGPHPGNNLPTHPRLDLRPLTNIKPGRLARPLQKSWWRLSQLPTFQVFHPTYYTLTGGLRFADIKSPVVITAHDFIAQRYPDLEPISAETTAAQTEAIRAARMIICVSKFTEADLLDIYPESAGKTCVVYHGSSFPVCETLPSDEIMEHPTFLWVGSRCTYKNFYFLLRAFAKAASRSRRIKLHLVGRALTAEERWMIHFLHLSDRVTMDVSPSEERLHELYRSSVALVYPSRHEGFGIPPLEAMSAGTLAITSNATSLPEVVADAGILLDPTDEDAWADCIVAAADGQLPRSQLLQKGRERAQQLTWAKSAEKHADIYRQLAAAGS